MITCLVATILVTNDINTNSFGPLWLLPIIQDIAIAIYIRNKSKIKDI